MSISGAMGLGRCGRAIGERRDGTMASNERNGDVQVVQNTTVEHRVRAHTQTRTERAEADAEANFGERGLRATRQAAERRAEAHLRSPVSTTVTSK